MKSAVWRPHLNAVSPLVSLLNSDNLIGNRSNANSGAVGRICNRRVTSNTLPRIGREHAASRMRNCEQILPSRIKTHRDQTANEKMFGMRHRVTPNSYSTTVGR